MIDRERLTQDLQKLVGRLEADLRDRVATTPELRGHLEREWRKGKDARRTSEAFEVWAEGAYTQSAVSWVLACVFVRYLEDNEYLDRPYLSGPGVRADVARDHRMEAIKRNPRSNERDYLQGTFDEVGRLPAMAHLLADRRAAHWSLPLSADGAKELYEFWQKREASGAIAHDFTDPAGDTRFLGDLYQDLSEAARKRYALLQTPDFVEEFLLNRALNPAIEEFGLANVTLIDPTCGSGHFLLGAFARLFDRRAKAEPATPRVALAQSVLRQVAGVDLNPYAVAITRFRLLLAALRASGVRRLSEAPAFEMNLAAGDSLLHGQRRGADIERQQVLVGDDPLAQVYETEDAAALRVILGRTYQVVVGNPPYITVKDPLLNEEYRRRYGSCYRQYSLCVPFLERFFDLSIEASRDRGRAGFIGVITSNAFMKREFGKRLIEEYIPNWDITLVADTANVDVPEHGTATVILVGRNRAPTLPTVRAVLGIRRQEPAPEDPAHGLVWLEMLALLDAPSATGEYVSVADVDRAQFHRHPWSLAGGGAQEVLHALQRGAHVRLADVVDGIGACAVTRDDEVFLVDFSTMKRRKIPLEEMRPVVQGGGLRDWSAWPMGGCLWPYDRETLMPRASAESLRWLWRWKAQLSVRVAYGQSQLSRGLPWFSYSMFFADRYLAPLSIAFAEVATHNHFYLRRGDAVFTQTSPMIRLKPGATELEYLGLLGLLNSSAACFWMKQVFYCKGSGGVNEGIKAERWEQFFQHDGTKLRQFPIPRELPVEMARRLDECARMYSSLPTLDAPAPSANLMNEEQRAAVEIREKMIAMQEEVDWACYSAFGLLDCNLGYGDDVPGVRLGERAFEIALARRMRSGSLRTAWFERHGSCVTIDVPTRWPLAYRSVVQRRLEAIESDLSIRLLEQPEYKRRWNDVPWRDRKREALRGWLLRRLEAPELWLELKLLSVARIADRLRGDKEFLRVAGLYRESDEPLDLEDLIAELIACEGVAYLSGMRYTESGLTKRRIWERIWASQRSADGRTAMTAVARREARGLVARDVDGVQEREVGVVPPRYEARDFRGATAWRLRGRIDVPRECFLTYPGAAHDADPSPVAGWAGWDHLQRAQALAAYLLERVERDGWGADRVTPLLAGIEELLPWIKQWHNEVQPDFGMGMGDYFERFLDEQVRSYGLARETLRAWVPPTTAKRSGKRKRSDDA